MGFSLLCLSVILQALVLMMVQVRMWRLQRKVKALEDLVWYYIEKYEE